MFATSFSVLITGSSYIKLFSYHLQIVLLLEFLPSLKNKLVCESFEDIRPHIYVYVYDKLNMFLLTQFFISLQFFSLLAAFSFNPSNIFKMFQQGKVSQQSPFLKASAVSTWEQLNSIVLDTPVGRHMKDQEELRAVGDGLPHTDAKLRLFGTTGEPRVVYYRDTAAWCPYCQKVWILLEEKQIPYRVEKINMRSYGDKPQEFLREVPNGLLPAIKLDGVMQTDSLQIMLNLERNFPAPKHKKMWPSESDSDYTRTVQLMRLERDLFSRWCTLVFRPSIGGGSRSFFEEGLDLVNQELTVTNSPWFLDDLSIVDLTYVTHIERMCASVAYWSGFKVRGDGRWPAIERWLDAFESMPSYMATKSDYYTHVMDIPPQYGPGFPVFGNKLASIIDGKDKKSWKLPLQPFSPSDVEPVSQTINPGDVAACQEAAYKMIKNHAAITRFALRGPGRPGKKQFQVGFTTNVY